MKSMKWLALVVAVIVVLNLRTTGGAAGRKSNKPAKTPPPPAAVVPKAEDIVEGYGPTAEQARETALKNSRLRVEDLLTQRLSGTGWSATDEQLDTDFLVRHSVIQPRGEPEPAPVNVDGKPSQVARCRVELTHSYLKEIETAARQQTVQERHSTLARVLAGILAVALVTAAYLRLEESTRGYATKLLRLVAVVVLAVVGAGLYLTR